MMIYLLRFLLFFWCFLQNLVGFIYTRFGFKKYVFSPYNGPNIENPSLKIKLIRYFRTKVFKNIYYLKDTKLKSFGVSLGNYICLGYAVEPNAININTIQHENGHRVQSALLGPLYLPFIGLFSLIHFIYHRLYVVKKYDKTIANELYHHFFTEKWADNLGNC